MKSPYRVAAPVVCTYCNATVTPGTEPVADSYCSWTCVGDHSLERKGVPLGRIRAMRKWVTAGMPDYM